MSNHIKIKLLDFVFAEVPQEQFNESIDIIVGKLRKTFPRYKRHPIHNGMHINIDFANNTLDSTSQSDRLLLLMLDAEGMYGLKIYSSGIKLSTSEYVAFDELKNTFKKVVDIVQAELEISHYSKISLRNINLFDSNKPEYEFIDIIDSERWGSQDFNTLSEGGFDCSGGATRHEYVSGEDSLKLTISSAILFPNHSYIPREEWDIWKFRGNIPAVKPIKDDVKLIIDIFGTQYASQLTNTNQNNVSDYGWEKIDRNLDAIHDLINKVYQEIAGD